MKNLNLIILLTVAGVILVGSGFVISSSLKSRAPSQLDYMSQNSINSSVSSLVSSSSISSSVNSSSVYSSSSSVTTMILSSISSNQNTTPIQPQSSIPKTTQIVQPISNSFPVDTTSTGIKFLNQSKFTKSINQKSPEPLYYNGDSQNPKDAVYIVGVEGIVTYSNYSKDSYTGLTSDMYGTARIIKKQDVLNSQNSPDYTANLAIINNYDNLISGKSDDVTKLKDLFRTGIGGYAEKYGRNLEGYKIQGLDSQRAYLSVAGQGNPLSLVVNIIGKKGNDYLWIRKDLYEFSKYPAGLMDKINPATFDTVLSVYDSDPRVQVDIEAIATKLTQNYSIL
jgi:hypothetical protein